MRLAAVSSLALAASVAAQSNVLPGLDLRVSDVPEVAALGRRGPAYPGGEVGIGVGHSYCNTGTVDLPWVGTLPSGVMTDTYPKIAYLLARETGGRMVQVSGRSFVKHSTAVFNFASGPCTPCNAQFGPFMYVGCSDTYSSGINGNRFFLGPPDEIDPWLGTWDAVGSYFDRGDPQVAGAAANDGMRSLTFTQVSGFDAVKNRVTVPESELVGGGDFVAQVQLVIQGEPVAARSNNFATRRAAFSWSGTAWAGASFGQVSYRPVLAGWSGADHAIGGDDPDGGRFMVAVKVTGPSSGMWHYEYAVHNLDNHRGAASLRIPVRAAALVQNIGFRDVDGAGLNDWAAARQGGELAFLAGVDNALDWNNIFNFWFDCSDPPLDPAARGGGVILDHARPGPGAMSVFVDAKIPARAASVTPLGSSCGISPGPGLVLTASARPVLGTQFALTTANVPPGTLAGALLLSFGQSVPGIDMTLIGMPGCVFHGAGNNVNVGFPPMPPASVNRTLTVPNVAAMVGGRIVAQSFAATPGTTPLGVIASNGLLLELGAQ